MYSSLVIQFCFSRNFSDRSACFCEVQIIPQKCSPHLSLFPNTHWKLFFYWQKDKRGLVLSTCFISFNGSFIPIFFINSFVSSFVKPMMRSFPTQRYHEFLGKILLKGELVRMTEIPTIVKLTLLPFLVKTYLHK